MRFLLLFVLLFTCVTGLFAQSPGAVSGNLRLWLKADENALEANTTTAEDGETVDRWDDNSPDDNDAVNATDSRRPLFQTNIINGNPALEFNGTKYLDTEALSGIGATESFHAFVVFKQNSFVAGGNDASGTFIIDRPTATNNLTTFKMINTDKYFYQRRDDNGNNLSGPISVTAANTTSFILANYYRNTTTTREGIYLDGRLDIDQAGIGNNITGPVVRIGNHATNIDTGGLNGYVAEVIIYNTTLTDALRRRIETYLAIKYGITLASTVDYVRSDATVVYPTTNASHSGYVNDIAGIGQDNNSELDHEDSKSQNTNSVVRVYNPSGLGNNEFLIWGSNNGSLTTPNTADVDGTTIRRRLSRIWKVAETGSVGDFTMEFDLSAVPGAKTQAALRMLIDRDGDGFSDNDRTPLTGTLAGNIFTVTVLAANLENGDRFTIGTTNTTTTPLPIELSEFNVTYESPVVVATWRTASELNNDHFTVERAGSDLIFGEVGTKPGAGTSKISHSYSMIDSYPYEGPSYYRLKQTDFDGTTTYSDTKYMFIEETKKQLAVFPNPNDGLKLQISWGRSKFDIDHVEVINQFGKSVEYTDIKKEGLYQYSMDIRKKLAPGVYVVRVHYNGKDEFVKLMVK
jgi:hypothetical protein